MAGSDLNKDRYSTTDTSSKAPYVDRLRPWHPELHGQTGVEIAAQMWCEPRHSHLEIDIELAASIAAAIEREQCHTDAWYDTAAGHHSNEEYYRGLCDTIGEALGEAAYTQDDGGRSDSVLRAKLPELVVALASERQELIEALKAGLELALALAKAIGPTTERRPVSSVDPSNTDAGEANKTPASLPGER